LAIPSYQLPPQVDFLGLTELVLALCVEVDRGGCELRYADPLPAPGVASRITERCHGAA
jgi:hypothetical protein